MLLQIIRSVVPLLILNLYLAISQSQVRRKLAEEDAEHLKSGQAAVVHNEVSLSVMLTIGIDLEDQQYVLPSTVIHLLTIT